MLQGLSVRADADEGMLEPVSVLPGDQAVRDELVLPAEAEFRHRQVDPGRSMIIAMAGYVIRGGQPGYDRLLLLARERWPDTQALLKRAGISAGMRCADIGCGGGAVTLEIAGLVAPGGRVVGIDSDEVKLGLARQAAAERGMDNVEFRVSDALDWDEAEGHDLVYSRFLLQHLADPASVLRRMWAAVASGGVLIVEDADFDGWCCDPPNEGFAVFLDTYRRVLAGRGGDHAIGRKLQRYFLAAGIPAPRVDLVQAVHQGEAKALAWSTLDATAGAVLADGLATEDELTAALDSLRAFTDDPHTLICGPRVFQLWARR
jgi:ubiquinone/menaquinone biosynthesis C-methylase UbiE